MIHIEQRTMKKVFRRLIPFLMFCYFFNFLDRTNVSFAALQMNKDLGFSASVFGFGSGILFLAYMLCETPSNVLLVRFGARKWLARIMISWGIIASCMVFVTGKYSFYTLRVFLGAAEAGFFPGIIYYLTLWFPGVYRARVTGLFMACIPLSAAIGSPLSTSLLYLDGILDLRGWQWLFLLEGIPSVLLGVATFFYLTERPRYATGWLVQDERDWLEGRITAEHDRKQAELSLGMWQTLMPQAFSTLQRRSRVSRVSAACTSAPRTAPSPALVIEPLWSISPEAYLRGIRPKCGPMSREWANRADHRCRSRRSRRPRDRHPAPREGAGTPCSPARSRAAAYAAPRIAVAAPHGR
jgi:MFS family permease